MKKRIASVCLVAAILFSLTTVAAAATADQMTDLEGHWAKEYIAAGMEANLFQGVSETSFEPDETVTRSMFVTVLGRFAESLNYEVKGASDKGFEDVAEDQWYTEYVNWAAANEIVNGYSETVFGTNDAVSREQLCTMIYRFLTVYAKVTLPEFETQEAFQDQAEISDYATEAVKVCQGLGLIQGSDGKFEPQKGATRAEMAAIFYRLTATMQELSGEGSTPTGPSGGGIPEGGFSSFEELADHYMEKLASAIGENDYLSFQDGIHLTVPLSSILQDEFQFNVIVNGLGELTIDDLLNDRADLFSYATADMMAELDQIGQNVIDNEATLNEFLSYITKIEIQDSGELFLDNSSGNLKFSPAGEQSPILQMLAGLSDLLTTTGNSTLLADYRSEGSKTEFCIPIVVYGHLDDEESSYVSSLTLRII